MHILSSLEGINGLCFGKMSEIVESQGISSEEKCGNPVSGFMNFLQNVLVNLRKCVLVD